MVFIPNNYVVPRKGDIVRIVDQYDTWAGTFTAGHEFVVANVLFEDDPNKLTEYYLVDRDGNSTIAPSIDISVIHRA